MVRKRVWLGILLLVIGLSIATDIVNAYTRGFKYSNMYCGSNFNSIRNSADFETSFFKYYRDGRLDYVTGGHWPDTRPTGMELFYRDVVADNDDNCMGQTAFSDETYGLFLFGYLYLFDPVSEINFNLVSGTSRNNDAEEWCTNAGVMFYKIDDINTFPISIGTGSTFTNALKGNGDLRYPGDGGSQVCDDDSNSFSWPDDASRVPSDVGLELDPGLYFVTAGIASHVERTWQTWQYVAGGVQFKFNSAADTDFGSYSTYYTSGTKYGIFNDRLSAYDLNTLYPVLVENTTWLCNLAGGQRFMDIEGITLTYDELKTTKDEVSGVNFNTERICCGDDWEELSSYNYNPYSFIYKGKTYLCSGGQWDDGNVETTCRGLADGTAIAGANVYDSSINTNNYRYYQIGSGVIGGHDGCCGDDVISGSSIGNGAGYGYNSIFTVGYEEEYSGVTQLRVRYDYGYSNSAKVNMCYATLNGGSTVYEPTWSWKNAAKQSYEILPLYRNNKTVDIISNGAEWYFCNASGRTGTNDYSRGLTANALQTGKSPPSKDGEGQISCVAVMNALFGSQSLTFIQNESCPTSEDTCCGRTDSQTGSFSVTFDNIGDCAGVCRTGGVAVSDPSIIDCNSNMDTVVKQLFCTVDPFSITDPASPIPPDQYTPEKSSCLYDLSGCLEAVTVGKRCEIARPEGLGGTACSTTQFCVGGRMVASLDSPVVKSCCYSPTSNTRCIAMAIPQSEEECTSASWGGKVYNPETASCNGDNVPINSDSNCCFNEVVESVGLFGKYSLFAGASPSKFACYSDYSGNYFAECIYDKSSVNFHSSTDRTLDNFKGQLRGVGATTHSVHTFDVVDADNNLVADRVTKVRVSKKQLSHTYLSTAETPQATKKYYLSTYDYLEFDLAYPTTTCQLTLSILYDSAEVAGIQSRNNIDVCRYLTQGDRSNRWNHVRIPIKDLGFHTRDKYFSMKFVDAKQDLSAPYYLVFDSVRFSTDATNVNSPTQYCTGGLGTWISELDPVAGTVDVKPYKLACEAQAAYDWTGQRCCGDDTHFNYGEFYTDSIKGCFNGSKVDEDWAVSYVNGVQEISDKFDKYTYKGLLYSDGAFVGCQINTAVAPYSTLLKSSDGEAGSGNLVTTSFNTQCTVNGSYYCSNGAWRKLVKTGSNVYTDFGGVAMTNKLVPGGAELVNRRFQWIPSCTDGVRNQDELGIDCGGLICGGVCPTCDGIDKDDPTVCTAHGKCVALNDCECDTGWDEPYCDKPICVASCGDHGTCTAPDTCTCAANWEGDVCNIPDCTPDCAGNQVCVTPPTCSCAPGWSGTACSTPTCTSGCSHGTCTVPYTCNCDSGWKGTLCDAQTWSCGGIEKDLSTVCSSHGTCASQDVCNPCTNDYRGTLCQTPPTCDDGIINQQETGVDCGGPNCEACPTCSDNAQNRDEDGVDCGGLYCSACPATITCNGVISTNYETVCGGHGDCVDQDTCECDDCYGGVWCSYYSETSCSWYGSPTYYCNGIASNNADVCNGNGYCVDDPQEEGYIGECNCRACYVGSEWCDVNIC